MKNSIRKLLSLILVVFMVAVMLPTAVIAEDVNMQRGLNNLDKMWGLLAPAETEALQTYGMDASRQTVEDVLAVARENPFIDQTSFTDIDDNGFSFKTTDGLHCAYDFRVRTAKDTDNSEDVVRTISYAPKTQTADSIDVLLIGPYYGSDSSFTSQYRDESEALANLTGGEYTLLSGTAASPAAICANFSDKGIIIFDSHGTRSGSSSYLCLTTTNGLDSSAYSDGSAISLGYGECGIDGRYIAEHMTGEIANSLVWMAICEGMMTNGLCAPLRNAGAGVVYGYSQSVTFIGDYIYEETFFDYMMEGRDVAASAAYMKEQHGVPDPYGDAYPIFVSDTDVYPSNPDAPQTVTSNWVLPLDGKLTSISPKNMTLQVEASGLVNIHNIESASITTRNYTPTNFEWTVADTSIARITRQREGVCTVQGLKEGTTTLTCRVYEGTIYEEVVCNIEVQDVSGVYVKTNVIEPGEEYLIAATSGNSTYLLSGDSFTTSISNYSYEFLHATKASVSTLGAYLGTSDTTECIFALEADAAIPPELLWSFTAVPTSTNYSFIRNANSNENLTRYTSGNYTDLYTDSPSSSANAQRWYYQNGGLCARSTASGSFSYVTLTTGSTPYFSAGTGSSSASTTVAPIQLYKKVSMDTYTVTFNVGENGTCNESSRMVAMGDSIGELPEVTANYGWEFDGWFTQATGGEEVLATTIPTENMDVYAQYTELPKYTITFNDGENGTCAEATRTVVQGDSIGELPEVTADFGWDFDGWFTAETGGEEVLASAVPTGNVEVFAQYSPWSTSTVTFTTGDNGECEETSRTVYQGYAIGELPVVTAVHGWDFDGWFTAVNGGTQISASYVINSDTEVFAHYSQWPTYTITVHVGEHGTCAVDSFEIYQGDSIGDLPAVTANRGWEFQGWYTSATNGEIVNVTDVPTSNIDIYAHYIERPLHNVTFVYGAEYSVIEDVVEGTTLPEMNTPTVPSINGYVFAGWALNDVIVPADYAITEEVTLTAKYGTLATVEGPFTITLLANSGTVTPTSMIQAEAGDALVLPTPAKEGCEFIGWFDGENYYAAGANYIPQANKELVAVWQATGDCEHVYEHGACSLCGALLAGDANCDNEITAADAAEILRSVVRLQDLSTQGILNGDVDNIKEISAADAATILRYIVRLIDSLPIR